MTTKTEIAAELYEAARKLGAKSDLLMIIGSWDDTRDDVWVLDQLRRWNAAQMKKPE